MSISEASEALVDAVNGYGAAVAAKLTFQGLKDQVVFVSANGESMALEGADLLILYRRVDDDTKLDEAKLDADHHPILDTRTNTAWRWVNNAWVSEDLQVSPAFPLGRIYKDLVGFRSSIYDVNGWTTLGAPSVL